MKRIVEVWDQIEQIYIKLNQSKLNVIELDFLEEYAKVTDPVIRTLEILQRDKNCFL